MQRESIWVHVMCYAQIYAYRNWHTHTRVSKAKYIAVGMVNQLLWLDVLISILFIINSIENQTKCVGNYFHQNWTIYSIYMYGPSIFSNQLKKTLCARRIYVLLNNHKLLLKLLKLILKPWWYLFGHFAVCSSGHFRSMKFRRGPMT